MMRNGKNITGINTRITALADTIQKARAILCVDNEDMRLNAEETRRIILICLILYRTKSIALPCKTINLKCAFRILKIDDLDMFNLRSNSNLQTVELSGALNELSHIDRDPDYLNLINYALEALEYDTEAYFNVKVSRGTRSSNRKKKDSGIYYTPLDVANFIVSQCVDAALSFTDMPSVLDCSCGSGVFLIQSLCYLECQKNTKHDLNTSIHILDRCIWGVDISPAAVDCCKVVLLQYYFDHYEYTTAKIGEIWRVIEKSILIGDATHLQEISDQNSVFPRHFDCIVGNPPYVNEGRESNMFIPFVDNMIAYSSNRSCSALILPLSICYSQGGEFVRLRNKIQTDRATWIFMNYDRSPDSLFGDQVKTRNTILFRRSIEATNGIFTTNLQRWTSVNRSCLFTDYDLCNISGILISKYVPKISNSIEKVCYERISSGDSNLYSLFEHSSSGHPLIVNGTAYNWLCVYDHIPPSVDECEKPYISGSTRVYHLPDCESRDFCIAMLSNRIAYWFWSVIGDGFHFNTSFLYDFKVGKESFTKSQYTELCHLGRRFSEQIKKYPTVSYNAGKKIISYSHWEAMDTIREIEKLIIKAFDLPNSFASHIEKWYYNQVHCNRNNEKR